MRHNRIIHDERLYTFRQFEEDLFTLQATYPQFALNTIGHSIMGRPIYEVVIGNGDQHIHINGSFHAHESITTNVIMRFINDYLHALSTNEPIRGHNMHHYFNEITLSIVPMVNPDGVDLLNNGLPENERFRELVLDINNQSTNFDQWKANIRGVDLNNQFPANWELEQQRKPKQPSPRDFPGYGPLTEPEALAIYDLTLIKGFDRVLALHTQGEIIFWGYEGLEPPISRDIAQEYSRVSGYRPIQYVDSHAGYKDWFIQDFRRPGFTLELGQGVNPLPITDLDEMYEETLGIFLANIYV
ncbi:g-D-glutamyl-meso-diaminopimelate peptidase [Alkalibacillus filiformis]|uniref:G-D-glutamyl-meso-diaminopimelate peptidase n=1 Tax=Alkalibacillus filiformis TaxID=200990 RepID=A0ABU0DR38_9BACI|nr:M14 family metallocarboxypeptidase [Alkalibacillus filiformis]MDQ0350799.1 g-D-glutamyl-meso-diaminopimelate peptidase [Alkalibacillus filiformis]